MNRASVSQDLQRRAAQLIEDVRGTGGAPGWDNAQLGRRVYPYYRPDVKGVAYYEFTVLPAGFIVLSTGEHDFPIPHWNFAGKPIGARLIADAHAKGGEAARLYKIDALSYLAENSKGQAVSWVGSTPARLTGLHESMIDAVRDPQRGTTSGLTYMPGTDGDRLDRSLPSTFSDAHADGVGLDTWRDWSDMKAGFTQSFGVLAESLRRNAESSWKAERAAADKGVFLRPGVDNTYALLRDNARVSVTGSAAADVHVQVRNREGLPPVLVVRPNAGLDAGATVGVNVTYGNGSREQLSFVTSTSGIFTSSSWSAWTYYWAGNLSDQRDYKQFTINGCASGCGGTAWAMLFGWADHQAHIGNSYWAPRWGLYRQNGGYGADADAPSYQDTGIVNIQKEIRNYIGTFCANGQGATFPWAMDDASAYFSGRTGARLTTHYNSVGITESRLREYARNSIRDRHTPAILGTGWLEHYPLAWGYAWQSRSTWYGTDYNRWFYVNNGWSGTNGDGWIEASTWFAGELYP